MGLTTKAWRKKMEKKDRQQKKPAVRDARAGAPQTDLAEGELETVEESIRIHERKCDLAPGRASQKHGKK
jgi:hypothetical protein